MNTVNDYPNLLKPIKLGNTVFRNRIFAAPTGHYNLTPYLAPTDDYVDYFARKAKGGCASVNIGECYVDDEGIPTDGYDVIRLKDHVNNRQQLAKLASEVTRYGAVATIELQKPGMASSQASADEVLLGPSDGICEFNKGIKCRAMTEEEIYKTIDNFAEAALYAKGRGFGMVTVHAGHGWLLHQFLSPYTNKRTDKWGGSAENRARFTVEVVDAIHRKCGRGFPVEVRISGSEVFEGGFTVEDAVETAKQLDGHANLIHVSVGNLFAPHLMYVTHPGVFSEEACNVKYAAEIKKHVKTPVATVGALSDPAVLEEIIASGKADVVELARGLICEPDLPIKLRTGRAKEARKCLRCFQCVGNNYKYGKMFCAINPESGKDSEIKGLTPPKVLRKVLVAGGGMAGMQAAITAAENGHQVILCEKKGELGGVILCERNVPFKKRVDEYIEQQKYLLEARGVEVRLNTPVTPELVAEIKPDAIIAAIGSKPAAPPIPGIENVKNAADVFADPTLAKGKTVILGAGLSGVELGIYLLEMGKEVELVEMAPNNMAILGEIYEAKIFQTGLKISFDTAASNISDKGVDCKTKDGEMIHIDADTVVSALGLAPLWEEAAALSPLAEEFYQIGDCRMPGNIQLATSEGWSVAKNIGRF